MMISRRSLDAILQRAKQQAVQDVQVSFQWKNPDFVLKSQDFLFRNPDFLLKIIDFIIMKNRRFSSR